MNQDIERNQNRKEVGQSSNTKEQENQVIRIPRFDFSDLVEKYRNSLVGRTFHTEGRSTEALLAFMPKYKIWDVEGRVKGTDLGNGRFQFDFDDEEDLLKVLNRRPCHFNRWSFSLERWEPTIREDFPNTMLFWVDVTGVPTIYKKVETFQGIGDALGEVKAVDVDGARVQVSLNGDQPLKFESKVDFENGGSVSITLKYDGLLRYCFTCKRISHDERTCPELTERERLRNKRLRAERSPSWEDHPIPKRNTTRTERYEREDAPPTHRRHLGRTHDTGTDEERGDLRHELQDKRSHRSKGVWERLEHHHSRDIPRYRERYHPYSVTRNETLKTRTEDLYVSSSRAQKSIGDREASSYSRDRRNQRHYGKDYYGGSDSQRTISDLQKTEYKFANLQIGRHTQPQNSAYERRNNGRSKAVQWKVKADHRQQPREFPLRIGETTTTKTGLEMYDKKGSAPMPENKDPQTGTNAKDKMPDVPQGNMNKEVQNADQLKSHEQNEAELLAFEKEMGIDKMDETFFDNDDLLDEELPETPNAENGMEEGEMEKDLEQIEAISQLSPIPGSHQKHLTNKESGKILSITPPAVTDPVEAELEKQNAKDRAEGSTKKKAPKNSAPKTSDLKGVSTKKLNALRARSSPKKRANVGRPRTVTVPRHEVFPSAIGKKSAIGKISAAKSGSVVSQKPPSTHI